MNQNLLKSIDKLILELHHKPMFKKHYKDAGKLLHKIAKKKIKHQKFLPKVKVVPPQLHKSTKHRTRYGEIIPTETRIYKKDDRSR